MKLTVVALVLAISACTSGSSPPAGSADIAVFDVAGDDDFVTPLVERAPAPDDAVAAYAVRSYADPAAFDEMLAQAQAVATPSQVVIAADLRGCILLTVWALPEPTGITVGYEFDSGIDCAEEISYRALFIIDETGTNAAGTWDYSSAPPTVTVELQSPN